MPVVASTKCALAETPSERPASRHVPEKRDALLDAIGDGSPTLDEIAIRMNYAAHAAAARISMAQIDGLVEEIPGGRFQRVRRPP